MAVVTHTLAPVYDQGSRVLILGTMPSPKSREYGFYYSARYKALTTQASAALLRTTCGQCWRRRRSGQSLPLAKKQRSSTTGFV